MHIRLATVWLWICSLVGFGSSIFHILIYDVYWMYGAHANSFSRKKNDLTSKENIVVPTIKHLQINTTIILRFSCASSLGVCERVCACTVQSMCVRLFISNKPLCHLEASLLFPSDLFFFNHHLHHSYLKPL